MFRTAFLPAYVLLALTMVGSNATTAHAHCQVPCGIYGDQLRFQQMLEDQQTIAKAQTSINDLSSGTLDAQGHNQLARWVVTKEEHAQRIQTTIAEYFLAQRIKPDASNYAKTLMAAHKVIIDAMKCKQSADPSTAEMLKASVLDLYRAYEGKEPLFEHTH
ncbi:superoxide dismutase, Ni [Neorhodopirellula pilleata]|uniref:Nickel-containing superoxide dismutase n=1 Tax=Neorhodopirellula pilleata TaxID=2714738 RepID=A0A5C5ZJN5_9BACT|nr:superoxide dismutase, Ni [Neorhodopirellula pilleata]TWT87031.1 Nickel-containing superoxide dismutase [Neorhodopirellula pilleata]